MIYHAKEWQRIGTKFLIDNPRAMLVADPGMGKTAMTLSALDLLKMGGSSFFPALVLAPKRVAEVVWDGERDKWDTFHDVSITKVLGERETRRVALSRAVSDLYVINYDNIPWLVEQFSGGTKWPFKTVIADESSRLKSFRLNKGGVRASALSKVARFTGRWWNLTGTPTPNGLQDLWGQMWFVDFGERLKRTYTAYLEAYFSQNPYTRAITPLPGAPEMIHAALADRLTALRAVDWLDLTEPQVIPIAVELPAQARQQYRQMEKDFFLNLDDVEIAAGNAAIKSQKLLQVASGSIYPDPVVYLTARGTVLKKTGVPAHLHDAKIEALRDVVEESGGEPLLVSYWWQFDVPRILAAFPKARVYSGKQDEIDFNAGKIPMLLLHEQSAFGLNLQEKCRDIVFYSYWWSGELWQQFIERAGPTRQAQAGSKRQVRVWVIQVANSIEQYVIDSNAGKISVEQALKRARARVRNG